MTNTAWLSAAEHPQVRLAMLKPDCTQCMVFDKHARRQPSTDAHPAVLPLQQGICMNLGTSQLHKHHTQFTLHALWQVIHHTPTLLAQISR
jgi:hypothetical protein